jgi:hypothetical protein
MYHNRIKDDQKMGEEPKTIGNVRGLTILRIRKQGGLDL